MTIKRARAVMMDQQQAIANQIDEAFLDVTTVYMPGGNGRNRYKYSGSYHLKKEQTTRILVRESPVAFSHLHPKEFRPLMINGMHQDHSWASAGQHYLNSYEYLRHK